MSNLLSRLSGHVTPAMLTPLADDGYTVNVAAVPGLVDFLLDAGAGGLFVGGSTGEGIMLTVAERRRLHSAAVDAAAGRAPVLVHVGANVERDALELAAHARAIGADGVVAITPTFFALDDDTIVDHFARVAAAAGSLPFMAYDIPHMAVNGITPGLFRTLAMRIPTFAGIKSSRTDIRPLRQLIEQAPDDCLVLAGNEPILLGSLALGAHGAISGLSTAVPEPFVALLAAWRAGDQAAALIWQRRINQALTLLPPGRRIGAIKAIAVARGVAAGPPVPPRSTVSSQLWDALRALLSDSSAD